MPISPRSFPASSFRRGDLIHTLIVRDQGSPDHSSNQSADENNCHPQLRGHQCAANCAAIGDQALRVNLLGDQGLAPFVGGLDRIVLARAVVPGNPE
jgi:hypothetical protein